MHMALPTPMVPWTSLRFHKGPSAFDTGGGGGVAPTSSAYHIPPALVSRVMELRDKIGDYDREEDADVGAAAAPTPHSHRWEFFKKLANPYEVVYTQKTYDGSMPPSLAIQRPLSRSYFKLVEMLRVCGFFRTWTTRIQTAHVCEGPGGFIEAILDEAERNRVHVAAAHAITLRPTQKNVPGWKRATKFLQRNRHVKISYGKNDTGDILHEPNQRAFIDTVCESGRAHLFTGDGGFDFSTDYAQQEASIRPLLQASINIGLRCLRRDGYMILKIFDVFQPETAEMLYGLASHFQTWTLYKPAMSRPCNSEQYFIGCKFRPGWVATAATEAAEADFYDALREHSVQHTENQVASLEYVYRLIEADPATYGAILATHERMSLDWCTEFGIPVLPDRIKRVRGR